MTKTPDQIRANQIFGEKVQMVMGTFGDIFGPLEMNVVFQAVASWVGMLIFNTQSTPLSRRNVIARFIDQIECVVAAHERGDLP